MFYENSNSDITQQLEAKIQGMPTELAQKKLDDQDLVPLNLNTRSVEDLKKMYRKTFLKLSTGKGSCEHCGAVTKNIVHYKSRLVLK